MSINGGVTSNVDAVHRTWWFEIGDSKKIENSFNST